MIFKKNSSKNNRRVVIRLLACLLVCQVVFPCFMNAKTVASDGFKIGFHFWKSGDIYEEAYQGIVDGLVLDGMTYTPFIFRSHRDGALARKNLTQMEGMGLDLIVSFSSAGTRIAQSMLLQTPVISTVINHPISLGIQKGDHDTEMALTGTSYYVDTQKQLALYRNMFPHLTRMGMIYDSNNPAGYLAEEPLMRKACEKQGISFFSRGIVAPADLPEATGQMVETGVDVIVIPTNQQVYAHLDAVLKITHPLKIPVVSMNKQGVESGALAALFADTYKLGRLMVPIARQILVDKKNVSDIPFTFIPEPDLIINLKHAQALDYEFSPAILGRAAIILD